MKYLSELYLNSCDLNCKLLAVSLHSYPNLKTLDIINNLISSDGYVSLFAALCNLQKLENLYVTGCNLGLEDANGLKSLIKTALSLHELSVGDHVHFSDNPLKCWLLLDFVSTILPVIVNTSKITHLTV